VKLKRNTYQRLRPKMGPKISFRKLRLNLKLNNRASRFESWHPRQHFLCGCGGMADTGEIPLGQSQAIGRISAFVTVAGSISDDKRTANAGLNPAARSNFPYAGVG
jgi:hypothetical protein